MLAGFSCYDTNLDIIGNEEDEISVEELPSSKWAVSMSEACFHDC